MGQWKRDLARMIALLAVFVLPCVILWAAGVMTMPMECFAVDSDGVVFVGTNSQIEVYEDKELIRTFSAQTSRGYHFCIENDTILLRTSTKIFRLNLDGVVIDQWSRYDSNAPTLQEETNQILAADGNTYTRDMVWLRERIVRNGEEVVYQISVINAVVRIVMFLSIVLFLVFTILFLKKHGIRYWTKPPKTD